MLALVGALGVLTSGLTVSNHVVSAAPASGLGSVIENFVSGPTAQSTSNSWQYFEIPDTLSTATLLPNWQTTGNEIISNQNQWDNDRVNGNYPFVQLVQTPPVPTFGGNAGVLIHPDNSSYRAAIGWKNTTGATVIIDYAATLKFAYPGNNSDGVTYSFQRGLSGAARYLALKSGVITAGSTATIQLSGSLVELQSGELIYLTVGNNGNYYWDHTIATMSISFSAPPVSTVVGTDTVVTFSSVGSRSWTVPANVSSLQYLIVGGGGGGSGGGGGAGGVLYNSSYSVTPGNSYTVVVGDGGSGSAASVSGGDGSNSSFNNIVAYGGGGGGARQTGGRAGASSGGSGQDSNAASGAASQGFRGGDGLSTAACTSASGGGGAGSAGLQGFTQCSPQIPWGGNGGIGVAYSISGSSTYYGGGGGGGPNNNSSTTVDLGRGGNGGGGNGGNGDRVNGTDGLANTGGGGGGGDWEASGAGNGGSGIVIVRYTTPSVPVNSAVPVISGSARTGATLTTTNGSWSGSPSSYTYQWKRATTSGGSYTNIASATSSTYVLTDDDIDKYIKVSVIATNGIGSSTAELSAATSVVSDLPDSVVPTATNPVSTATGFTFSISNYSASYTYVLTTSKGSVSRSTDDVTVTGLTAGESATVTIAVTRTNYKPGSKTVTGSATPAATTTTTAAPALSIVIQAPVTTVAQGQASVATIAPTTTTLPVLGANGLPVPTTASSAKPKSVVTTTLPAAVTTTTVGPPVIGKVAAGQTAVQVDGVDTDAKVSRENNQMVVNAGSVSATLSGADSTGKILPLDTDGTVHLSAGDVIKVSVGGFEPDSVVEVWLFSTPTQLGSAVVDADGTMSGTYKLPFGIKSGSHRVVVTAKLPNGKSTTFTLGILVGKIAKTSTLTRILIAIPITLAVGFGFLLPTQLRRRRKIRTA